jgi:hypothetical protein
MFCIQCVTILFLIHFINFYEFSADVRVKAMDPNSSEVATDAHLENVFKLF